MTLKIGKFARDYDVMLVIFFIDSAFGHNANIVDGVSVIFFIDSSFWHSEHS